MTKGTSKSMEGAAITEMMETLAKADINIVNHIQDGDSSSKKSVKVKTYFEKKAKS